MKKAAEILGMAPSTLHRWLTPVIIVGEQLTLGAPWRIRMTEPRRPSETSFGSSRSSGRRLVSPRQRVPGVCGV